MPKFLTVYFFCCMAVYHLGAQILPKENSTINYRLVGFSFPEKQGVSKYTVEIASGNYTDEGLFVKNIVESLPGDKNKIIGVVPSFGKEYTWRTVYTGKDDKETHSRLHHFTTGTTPQVDTNISHLKIIKNAEKYKDAYILADGTGVLYDMNGAPLWYLPNVSGSSWQAIDLLDTKISAKGTITYIHTNQVYETDYNGKVLWKGPNSGKIGGGKTEDYHHEFTRLDNGNYMVFGRENVTWKMPDTGSLAMTAAGATRDSNNILRQNIVFGTLIEYDKHGNIVWSWKSSNYAKECDLYNSKTNNWRYDINDIHENAFYFDQQDKVIYISYKNIDRIIKIKYPEGTVLNTYGETYQPGMKGRGNNWFCHQHSCRRSAEGYLYMYNNNDCNRNELPKLVMIKEPVSLADTLQKIWEYDCTMDGIAETGPAVNMFTGGGNVFELPGGELFANMDSKRYNKAFIVDRDKKTLWSVLFEQLDPRSNRWKSFSNYRVSIITDHKSLENLIWNQEM